MKNKMNNYLKNLHCGHEQTEKAFLSPTNKSITLCDFSVGLIAKYQSKALKCT